MSKNYVGKTDKGYIKGDLVQGIEFVEKLEARQFTTDEAIIYGDSMAQDMFDFCGCKTFEFEEV